MKITDFIVAMISLSTPINKKYKETNYLSAIKKYTSSLLEEVKGIAEGSKIDFDTIFAFQLLDEFLLNAEESRIDHCSSIEEGLPVVFIIRGLLEQSSQADAINFLHRVKHASPQNYLIGGPRKVFDFECSANTIEPFEISKRSKIVYHTNHALVNKDFNENYLNELKKMVIKR